MYSSSNICLFKPSNLHVAVIFEILCNVICMRSVSICSFEFNKKNNVTDCARKNKNPLVRIDTCTCVIICVHTAVAWVH